MDEPRVRDRRPLRQRVSKACDSCRSRKDRCDGRKPACSLCLKLGRACLYNTQSKKRGLKEGYVRGLEKLWALALRRIPGFEQDLINVLREASKAGPQRDELARSWFELDENRSLIRTWKDSSLFKEFDQVLELLDALPEKSRKKDPASQNSAGASQSNDVIDDVFGEADVLQDEPKDIWPAERPTSTSKESSSKSKAPITPLQTDLGTVQQAKLPSSAWQLLELYFSYTHCWFPILEKHDVVKVLYEWSNNAPTDANPGLDTGPYAVLWALLAYTDAQFATMKGEAMDDLPSDDQELNSEAMYIRSRDMIPLDTDNLNVFHVQALLLLTLTDMHGEKWQRAWLTVGQAARAGVVVGLHLNTPPESVQQSALGRASHVFYGCFLLDSIVSARLGHQPQLRERNISGLAPVDETGLEEWEPWKGNNGNSGNPQSGMHGPCAGPSTYNLLMRVMRYLNRPLCSIADNNDDEDENVSRLGLEMLFANLRSWGSEQPFFSHMDLSIQGKAHIKHPLLPHQIHLRLSYITALLYIYTRSKLLPEQIHTDYAVALIGQGCRLIEKHAIFFGYGTLPPTYEYFAHVICDSLEAMHRLGVNVARIRGDLRDMKDSTYDIGIVWPGFQNARDRFLSIFGKVSKAGLGSVHNPTRSVHSEGPFSASGTESELFPEPLNANSSYLSQTQGSWPVRGMPAMVTSLSREPPSMTAGETVDVSSLTDPGTVAASDVDSVLQDFGAIDAMEWMNNWEESLTRLGFSEGNGMDQEFQTFWQNMQSG